MSAQDKLKVKPGALCEVVNIPVPRAAHNNGRFVIAKKLIFRPLQGELWLISASPALTCRCGNYGCDGALYAVGEMFLRPISDPDEVLDVESREDLTV